MLAQSTLKEGFQLAQNWGPVAVSLVGILFYALWNNLSIRKRAFDPVSNNSKKIDVLFDKTDKLFQKDAALDKSIQRKTCPKDVEDKLRNYQRKEVSDAQFNAINRELSDVKRLLADIHAKILSR